jgi:hypothetical protein
MFLSNAHSLQNFLPAVLASLAVMSRSWRIGVKCDSKVVLHPVRVIACYLSAPSEVSAEPVDMFGA